MDCPNCGKDVDNLAKHNHQFHEALEVYATEVKSNEVKIPQGDLYQYGQKVGTIRDYNSRQHEGYVTLDGIGIEEFGAMTSDFEVRVNGERIPNKWDGKHDYNLDLFGESRATERSKSEIQKEIKDLQEYINVASFENPLNMGDSNDKLSALQVEWTNATETDIDDLNAIQKDEIESSRDEFRANAKNTPTDKGYDWQKGQETEEEEDETVEFKKHWGDTSDLTDEERNETVKFKKYWGEARGEEGGQGSGPQSSSLPEQVGRDPALHYDPFEKEQDPLQTDPSLRQLKDSEAEDEPKKKPRPMNADVEPNITKVAPNKTLIEPAEEIEPEEKWDKDDDIGKNYAEPNDDIIDDDSYWSGRVGEEIEHQKDKPEISQKDWEEDLAGLKDEYATEEDDEEEEKDGLAKAWKEWEPDKKAEEADADKCEGCDRDVGEDELNADGYCEDCVREQGIDYEESKRDAYDSDKNYHKRAREAGMEPMEGDDKIWEEDDPNIKATEDETETSDDGTDISTPMTPDVDDTDTDAVATFTMESWDGRTSFNTKVEAFESLGISQGDSLKLAELNWRELSIEVRGALNEFADNDKEEKRIDSQDAFNDEGDGVGSQPDTQIKDLDEIDYNIIGDNPLGVEKYQCEHCNSGFKSNEALMIHYNDTHIPAREFMLDVPNSCNFCGKEIPSDISMGEHLAYDHGISLDTKLENGMVTDGPIEPVTKTVEAPVEEPLATEAEGDWDECQDCNFIGNTIEDTNKHKQETGHNTEHFGFQNAMASEEEPDPDHMNPTKVEDYDYESDKPETEENLKKKIKSNEVRAKKAEAWKPHIYKATEAVSYAEEEFKEDEHPREDSGKFTSGGGGGAKTQTKEKPKSDIKSKKLFDKAKNRAMKGMKRPDKDDNYEMKKWNQVNNLDGFPTHSSQLRGVGVSVKAPLMKAHLQSVYPDNSWSVRTEYFSMGSAIRAGWKGGGKYPYGASKNIGNLYSNHGASNMQVDYSDTDNYVDLYDNRAEYSGGDGNHDMRDPQTLADSRQDRLRSWLYSDLRNVDYNDSHNWSRSVAEDLIKTGKFTPYSAMTDEHKTQLEKTWNEFQELEKKEGGVGEVPKDETPQATTPAFHTQQYMADDPKKPTQIPIDPATGEELPVSKFTPKLGDYTKHDVTKSTPDDVEKARKQMQRYKDTGEDQPEPWQKSGEAIATEDLYSELNPDNKCGMCGKTFDTRQDLEDHAYGLGPHNRTTVESYAREYQVLCQHCGLSFDLKEDLKCEYCGKVNDMYAGAFESKANEDYTFGDAVVQQDKQERDNKIKNWWNSLSDIDKYNADVHQNTYWFGGDFPLSDMASGVVRSGWDEVHDEVKDMIRKEYASIYGAEVKANEYMLDPKTTDITTCIICGIGIDQHNNPNVPFGGLEPTDHYYLGGELGGSDDKLDFESYTKEYLNPDEKLEYDPDWYDFGADGYNSKGYDKDGFDRDGKDEYGKRMGESYANEDEEDWELKSDDEYTARDDMEGKKTSLDLSEDRTNDPNTSMAPHSGFDYQKGLEAEGEKYECNACGKQFDDEESALAHTDSDHDEIDFTRLRKVGEDYEGFEPENELEDARTQMKTDKGIREERPWQAGGEVEPAKCPDCGADFDNSYVLDKHQELEHKGQPRKVEDAGEAISHDKCPNCNFETSWKEGDDWQKDDAKGEMDRHIDSKHGTKANEEFMEDVKDNWDYGTNKQELLDKAGIDNKWREYLWYELPKSVQDQIITTAASYESFVTEDDPDFENDPDYQGFVDGKKKESSQYTQQGIADAMADPDWDKLDEVIATEIIDDRMYRVKELDKKRYDGTITHEEDNELVSLVSDVMDYTNPDESIGNVGWD